MTETSTPDAPTLAEQVGKLYDLVAGYHMTHLVEIARELGVWEVLTREPGRTAADLAVVLPRRDDRLVPGARRTVHG